MIRYYILLCCDADKHSKRVSAITGEFSKVEQVRMIGPRHAKTFVDMPEQTISAIVAHFLRKEDFIRSQARKEVFGYNDTELYFLLGILSWSFECQNDMLPHDCYESSFFNDFLSHPTNEETVGKLVQQMEDVVFESYAELKGTRIRVELFPAIRVLYLDLQIRYEWGPVEIVEHLFEFLKLNL